MRILFTSYRWQAFLLILLWIYALLYSAEFLLSVSMIGLLLLSLFEFEGGKFGFRRNLKENARQLFKDKSWVTVWVPFMLVVVTAVYSTDDTSYLLERLRIKLPFLILPFAFVSIPRFYKKHYYHIFYAYLIMVFITSIGVFGNYMLNYEEINIAISKGQAIPTPTHHIRFSLMVAFAILVGFFLFRKNHMIRFPWEKWCIIGITGFLLIFIHILAVRSGLAVFFLTFLVLVIRFIFLSKKIIWGIFIIIGLLLLPLIAYKTIPSLNRKVNYMIWDLQQYNSGNGQAYSDSERLTSLSVASKIIRKHPVLGVGYGDLKHEVQKGYEMDYPNLPPESKKMPHNQYISIWASTGLIGLILFIIALIFPLFRYQRFKEPMFLSFILIIVFSFMVENTIETAVGIGVYLLFLLIGMNYLKDGIPEIKPEKTHLHSSLDM